MVPRLELMSALILSRLIITLSDALRSIVKVDDMYCWQDSQITLRWIYGITKEFKQFVQNRLVEIRKLVDFRKWRYCPSEENQSDIPTRGMKLSSLMKNSKWWKGPKFLSKTKEFWPSQLAFDNLENSFEEIKLELKENPWSDFSDVSVNLTCACTFDLENVISCEAYSNLDHLLRVTSYVLRFVNNLKSKLKKFDALVSELQLEEVEYSLGLWCRQAQSTFSEDSGFNRSKSELDVFPEEQGLLRCTGRIQNAPTRYAAKHPILIPRNHHLAELLVHRAHQNVKHNGTRETLTDLRVTFWIVRGCQLVKQLLSKCVICKRMQGKAYSSPRAPPLPDFRVSEVCAFSMIGVDFAGPVFEKDIFADGPTICTNHIFLLLLVQVPELSIWS